MIDHVSYSMISLHYKCEQAWKFRYANNIKIPPPAVAHRGGAMHKAAEINHKQKINTLEDLPEDALTDACRDEFVKRCKAGVLIPREDRSRKNDLLNNELNFAIETTKIYSRVIAPKIVPSVAEKKITAYFDLDLPLCGILDVMDIKNVIHEFKTTDKKKARGWERTELQPEFCTLLVKSYFDCDPTFIYHLIKNNDDERDGTRNADDCNRLLERVKIFIASIKTGVFKPAIPGHWLCSEKWCGYWPICKYAQK